MPAVHLASDASEHVELLRPRHARTAVPLVRHLVEHVHDAGTMSRLPAPVALDVMSQVPRLVASRRLVRTRLNRRRLLLIGWIDHQAEHYGKLVSNYRMVGIIPPISRKSSQ